MSEDMTARLSDYPAEEQEAIRAAIAARKAATESVVRMDDLTSDQRRVVLALIDAGKAGERNEDPAMVLTAEPTTKSAMRSEQRAIPTGRIKVDTMYQRPLNERRVERMSRDWSPVLAQTIDVSARNGTFFVIDGQHRLAAARSANVEQLAATVHYGLSPAEEADLFAQLNTLRVRPTTHAIFRAQLEAQDPVALEIADAARRADVGLELGMSGGRASSPRVTRAVGALLAVHRSGGQRLVFETLKTLRQAWPEDPSALEAVPLFGVASFIATYRDHPRFDLDRIHRKLGELPTSTFIRRAHAFSETSLTGGGSTRSAGPILQKAGPRRAVLEAFNRDLRGERLPDATLRDFRALAMGKNPWAGDTA